MSSTSDHQNVANSTLMDYFSSYSEEEEEEEEGLCLLAMQLASASVLPMVLKCAIELDLLELIKKAGHVISSRELAAQLPTTNPEAHVMLDRILRLLATYSVVKCTTKTEPDGGGGVERLYSLAPVCRFFTKNHTGVSMAPLLLINHDRVMMESWYYLKDAVLHGGTPSNIAYGMSAFEYYGKDQRFNMLFNQAMSDNSTLIMSKVVEIYDGFHGLKSLVDVAGGTGATLSMIISKYPFIKGINLDLPHVVQHAPSYPGVQHVGGDMFASVPNGDAIFMKWIIHNWSDEHCLKLLKNCYKALPENGKVILVECILPETDLDNGLSNKNVIQYNMVLAAHFIGGKERTEKEFQSLAKESGFKKFHKVCSAYSHWIMELCK